MKTELNTTAGIMMAVGLMAMAGAAGDCDGACGPGNTLAQMMMIAGLGLASFVAGAAILLTNQGSN